jgi:hypothetical protein
MKRRKAIRNLIIIAGGAAILPSCLTRTDKASITLKKITITARQEQLLAAIASAIIPKTDTLSASEVGAHLFALKMLDDCYEKEDQQKFVRGLDELENITKKRFGNSFVKCAAQQKETMLQDVENKGGYSSDVFDFYKIMKEKTIQGYLNSKYVILNIKKYEFIPSVQYDGYAPVKNT